LVIVQGKVEVKSLGGTISAVITAVPEVRRTLGLNQVLGVTLEDKRKEVQIRVANIVAAATEVRKCLFDMYRMRLETNGELQWKAAQLTPHHAIGDKS
jgi:hypothetical protein